MLSHNLALLFTWQANYATTKHIGENNFSHNRNVGGKHFRSNPGTSLPEETSLTVLRSDFDVSLFLLSLTGVVNSEASGSWSWHETHKNPDVVRPTVA